MSKGISLHIGVNLVDDAHYYKNKFENWNGELFGCEADALAMEALAQAQGFETNKLLTPGATRLNVINQIKSAALELDTGDYFFLTYSGHGSQVDDISMDESEDTDTPEEERDDWDETWCLFDAQLLDDELFKLWATFKKGVRILIFSDSCHSGTVSKGIGDEMPEAPDGIGFRLMPKAGLSATYEKHFDFYDSLQSPEGARANIEARVLLISGCQDDELSREDQSSDAPGGIFTKNILKAWEFGNFHTFEQFYKRVKSFMADELQTPNFYKFGGSDFEFEDSKPLFIK